MGKLLASGEKKKGKKKSHNAVAIRPGQQSTLSPSCCITAMVNNLT